MGWGENVNAEEDKKFVGISRRKQQQMEEEAKECVAHGWMPFPCPLWQYWQQWLRLWG